MITSHIYFVAADFKRSTGAECEFTGVESTFEPINDSGSFAEFVDKLKRRLDATHVWIRSMSKIHEEQVSVGEASPDGPEKSKPTETNNETQP